MIAHDLDNKVLGTIRRHPGIRCVEIAERAGVPVEDVRVSLARMKRAKVRRIRMRGATKATQYWAAKQHGVVPRKARV